MLLFALFVAVALSQTPPTLSNDFTGEIVGDFHTRGQNRHFEGVWYVDYTGKQHRYSGIHNKVEILDIYRVWNSTAGGNDWFWHPATKACEKHAFKETFYGLWDFLPHAKANGDCKTSVAGKRWTERDPNFEIDACIDGTNPLFVGVRWHNEDRGVFVDFRKFTAGRPAPSIFTKPTQCPA